MLFELLAVLCAGLAAAGVTLLVRRFARALPTWSVPVAAGAVMLLVAVVLEYSWYDRTTAALPGRFEVARAHESRAPWRPWTYLHPYVERFIAVDRGSIMTNEAVAGRRIVDLLLFSRWMPPQRVRAVFDCARGRRADLVGGATLAADGALEGARWIDTGPDDEITRVACRDLRP